MGVGNRGWGGGRRGGEADRVDEAEVVGERCDDAGGFFGGDAAAGAPEKVAGLEHGVEVGGLG